MSTPSPSAVPHARPQPPPRAQAPTDAAQMPVLSPVVDLESGAVLAVEATLPAAARGPVDVSVEAERLAAVGRRVAAQEPLLPLVLPVPAAAAAASPQVPGLLETALRRSGRRPRDVTLMLGADLADLGRSDVVRAVRHARGAGFRCAFGTDVLSPDLILDMEPFLFRFSPETVAGLPGDERRVAKVEGLARIGRGGGVFPLAAGVATVEQLAALREAGVRLGSGPLFADEGWAPGVRVRQIPEMPVRGGGLDLNGGPRVTEFIRPPADMPLDAKAEEVLEVFTNDPALNSVILIDHRERPAAVLDRARFLLAVTGPYGHALHAGRPAERLADPPRTIPRHAPALVALREAGASGDRVYDDLVAVNEFGQVAGVVHVGDLIAALSGH
ncbi:hypothetical protein GCM10009605_61390 [Nocardiopsis composta]